MTSSSLYRPEVDGLRTIAVLSVILFHADFVLFDHSLLPGGFIGVDVFFVISGYLISRLIMNDLDRGGFSFADFYERRIRRILPVLLLVLLASTPFAYFWLMPRATEEFGLSVLTSIFFSSNILFWSQDPYWAVESSLKPLLHTWSLAVEEQFYLVTPFLLIVLHKRDSRIVLAIFALLFAASLALAHVTARSHPSFAFYMLPTRFWEMLAGVILAVAERNTGRATHGALARIMPSLGIAMILLSCVVFDEATRHPSLLTLLPVVGTMLVIRFGSSQDAGSRLLSSKVFVGIGLISYGLYVWHFPIFVFGEIIAEGASNARRLSWVVLTFVLATASYFLVETPLRRRQSLSFGKAAGIMTALALPSLALAVLAMSTNGLNARFQKVYALYGDAEIDNTLLQAESWHVLSDEPGWSDPDRTRVLITGDSHSKDTYSMIVQHAESYPDMTFLRRAFTVTASDNSCFLDDHAEAARLFRSAEYETAEIVLISERFRVIKAQLDCLDRYIQRLKADGKDVVLTSLGNLYRRPKIDLAGSNHFLELHLRESRLTAADAYFLEGGTPQTLPTYERRYFDLRLEDMITPVNAALTEIAARHDIRFLAKQDYQCDAKARRCQLITPEGRKIYYDGHHLTVAGAHYLGGIAAKMGWLDLED